MSPQDPDPDGDPFQAPRSRLVSTLDEKYGKRQVNVVGLLLMIGAASLAVRLLIRYNFDRTALLYVGMPYAIALILAAVRPPATSLRWWHRYRNHFFGAMIVFFGSSVVLFEGFVCVLFFMPIYMVGLFVAFVVHAAVVAARNNRRGPGAYGLPAAALLLALEGVIPAASLPRENTVTVTREVSLSVADIRTNLSSPIRLNTPRHWLLNVFPMPHSVEADGLNQGDVHRVHTRYHRWFFANTHEGELELEMITVEPNRIATRVVSDSTYFANYHTLHGTQIILDETAPGQTRISLSLNYRRDLDPAWYFHPLQRFAMARMGEFLIADIMVRDGQKGPPE